MATLEVTNAAGGVLATITNPLTVRTTDRASALGEMACTLYVGSPGATSIVPGAYLRWTDGSYVFWGLIETVTRAEQQDGSAILNVTVSDIARELALMTAGALEMAAGSTPVALQTALNALLGYVTTAWTFTAAADVTSETIYLASDGASIWTMLLSIAEKLGGFLLRSATRGITITRTFTASGVTARSVAGDKPANVAALLSLNNSLDGTDVLGRVYPFTAGNAAMRLGLEKATVTPPGGFALGTSLYNRADGTTVAWTHLSNTAAGGVYSDRKRVVQFPEISPLSNSGPDITTAANALMGAAVQYLKDHQAAQRVLQLVMDDSPSIVGPMKTLIVQQGDLNAAYQVREATHAWAPNATVRSTLTLLDAGRMPLTGAGANVQTMEQARTYAAHAQLAPNVYQLGFNKPVDAQYGADFRFRFDEGITQVLMVALDVQLGPLQSTVRAIGAQAVKTNAVTQANHTHFLRLASHTHFMGDHTHTFDNKTHSHGVPITRQSGADLGAVRIDLPPATVALKSIAGSGVGTTDNVPTTSSGTSGGTTDLGGASVATGGGLVVTTDNANYTAAAAGGSTHDHTVDVSVSMDYGIFRDSAGNTFALADLEYQINSGAWAPMSGATSLGDGWYRLPLTNALVDAVTFYPLNKSNRVTIRAVVASAATETFVVGGTPSGQFNRWNDGGVQQQQITGSAATALALSPNGWLYILRKAAGTVTIYSAAANGTLAAWDTWTLSSTGMNAITVDARTGSKWYGGDAGFYGKDGVTPNTAIAGGAVINYMAAFAGRIYFSTASNTLVMVPDFTGSGASQAGVTSAPIAARNDGRVVQFSSMAATFQIKVWETDLSASASFTRSDAGNAWTPLAIASAANLVHVGCSDGRVRTYNLDGTTATLVWTSTGTPGATGYPTATSLLGVAAVLSSKAAMIDAQLTVRSVVQGIVMT